MKAIDLLDNLHHTGQLSQLVKAGFMHPSTIVNRNIYHAYNARLIETKSRMQAMEDVSVNFGVSFETVRLARRLMEFTIVKTE